MAELQEKKSHITLNDIKSPFIMKGMFSYLEEKQKLNMIVYNKELQKMLLVDLLDYQKKSVKYIIGGRNGKGKEYNINDILEYEGEYLNGKRNGKGKEYNNNDKLVYEGEYLKGEKNGKGKEYSENGDLIFDGEYFNGEKNNEDLDNLFN